MGLSGREKKEPRTHHTSVVPDFFWVLDRPDVKDHLLDKREDTIESDGIRHPDEEQQEQLSLG